MGDRDFWKLDAQLDKRVKVRLASRRPRNKRKVRHVRSWKRSRLLDAQLKRQEQSSTWGALDFCQLVTCAHCKSRFWACASPNVGPTVNSKFAGVFCDDRKCNLHMKLVAMYGKGIQVKVLEQRKAGSLLHRRLQGEEKELLTLYSGLSRDCCSVIRAYLSPGCLTFGCDRGLVALHDPQRFPFFALSTHKCHNVRFFDPHTLYARRAPCVLCVEEQARRALQIDSRSALALCFSVNCFRLAPPESQQCNVCTGYWDIDIGSYVQYGDTFTLEDFKADAECRLCVPKPRRISRSF